VSESKILELESDDIYSPVYPAIDEVAIGQSDYFLLKGNWDWGFHLKYSTKSEKLPVAGSLRVEEDESFLAKLVTLPEYIELENFDIDSTVPSHYLVLGENDSLDNVNTDLIELAIKETPTTIDGIINVNNLLTRYFIEDGLSTKFNEFLVNSNEYIGNFNSIEDYVKEYIRLNILPLYTIEANEFYYKKNAAATSANDNSNVNPNIIEFIALNDVQRFAQGYTILKSVQINKKDRLILKFTYAKNVSSGISISPKIKIKFI
jgi:hypothetical protein